MLVRYRSCLQLRKRGVASTYVIFDIPTIYYRPVTCVLEAERHVAVAPLRALVDPVATLKEVVNAAARSDAKLSCCSVSIARGEASAASDIDLAVVAPNGWDRRAEMADAVRTRLGNDSDSDRVRGARPRR